MTAKKGTPKPKAKPVPKKGAKKNDDDDKHGREKLAPAPSWPKSNDDTDLDSQEWKTWRTEVGIWRSISEMQGHSDQAMLLCFLKVLPQSLKAKLYAELEDNEAPEITTMMSSMEDEYGGMIEVDNQKLYKELHGLSRKQNETMHAFLLRWQHTRSKAIAAKLVDSKGQATDTHALLEAAQVESTVHSDILRKLESSDAATPREKLDYVLKELKIIAKSEKLQEEFSKAKKTQGKTALFGDKGGGKGLDKKIKKQKNRKGDWKGKGKGKGKGWKSWGDGGNWSGDPGKGGGKGKGKTSKGKGSGKGKGQKGKGMGGACAICGAWDHWKNECPQNPENQGGAAEPAKKGPKDALTLVKAQKRTAGGSDDE